MSDASQRLLLTERFTDAVEYARQLHKEFRKGTGIPYMAHLIGVAAIVMSEAGRRVPVTEDMVIAALLHDTVEDHGGMPRLREVEARFGPNVSRMVAGLSDTFAEDHDKKEGWEERKAAYVDRLKREQDDVLLISAADKLYNAISGQSVPIFIQAAWSFLISARILMRRLESRSSRLRAFPFGSDRRNISMTC